MTARACGCAVGHARTVGPSLCMPHVIPIELIFAGAGSRLTGCAIPKRGLALRRAGCYCNYCFASPTEYAEDSVPGNGVPDWGKLTVPPFCTAQMWLKLSVFSFEQTAQSWRCEIFRETGVTQVSGATTRSGTTSRRFSKFSSDFRHLISHRRSRYESRNDLDL
jgi:hypothetical protein